MYRYRKCPYFQTDVDDLKIGDIMEIITQHKEYSAKYKKNERYYDGKHDILKRTFDDPTKPNNKVVVDLPAYTVDIRCGYFSGEPITFTSDNEQQNEMIHEIMEYNDFQDINSELDLMSSIYGHAFLIVYLDEDGMIRLGIDDPYNTLVIHDSTIEHNVVGALRYFEYEDAVEGYDKIKITLYTKENIFELAGPYESPEIIGTIPNLFNDIPVIEFIENSTRCGSFEKHISIVDAIESILSNSVNEIDYFDNAYLHLKGVVDDLKDLDALGINPFEEMKSNRTLVTLADGDAKFLIKDINDTYIQNTLDRLTGDYHKLTKTPALSDENFGNASGVSLKYKLFNLEKDMSKKESKWRKSIQRMLELITTIQNLRGMNFDYRDIKITFTRALPNNEVEVADIITKLNGIVSHKTLLSQLDFIENPDAELELIAKEKQEYMDQLDIYSNPAQNKDDTEPNQDEADSNQTEDENNVDSNNKDGE